MNKQEELFVELFEKHYFKNHELKIVYRVFKRVWGGIALLKRDYFLHEYITEDEYNALLARFNAQLYILADIFNEMKITIDPWYPIYSLNIETEKDREKWEYNMTKTIKKVFDQWGFKRTKYFNQN